MTSGTISYYDGNIYLESDGNPYAVDITYKGKIKGESMLPDGFLIQEKNNRIFILRLSDKEFPNLLFSYNGNFKILKADLYSKTSRVTASLSANINEYNKITDSWSQLNSKWEEYGDSYYYGDSVTRKRTDIITNNLKSVSGNLVDKNGEEYYGDVHFHSEGYFMTGGVHTKDSVRLYHKNKKRIVKRKVIRAKQINGGRNG
tara:strand:- start:896 stop:1501 length:606 start_codon:yes stop_codon:yes gene_type:complete